MEYKRIQYPTLFSIDKKNLLKITPNLLDYSDDIVRYRQKNQYSKD